MKKLLFILGLLILSITGICQPSNPTQTATISDARTDAHIKNTLTIEGSFNPPHRDTNFVALQFGQIVIRPADSLAYISTGLTGTGKKHWALLGSSGTSGAQWGVNITGDISQQVDLQTLVNTKQNVLPVGTSLQYWDALGVLHTFPTIPAQVNLIQGTNINISGIYPNLTITNGIVNNNQLTNGNQYISANQQITITGDGTAGPNPTTLSLVLATVTTPGSCTDCQVTFDGKGRAITYSSGSTSNLVSSVFTRTGAIVAVSGDYTAAQVTNAVDQTASYTNPTWLVSIPYTKITAKPTTIAGYGITDNLVNTFNTRTGAVTLSSADVTNALAFTPVTNARTLTINGTTFDLTANRSWTISTGGISDTTALMRKANNLLDLASISAARINLGLGTAALQSNSFFLQSANNLSDLGSASIARTNLGIAVNEAFIDSLRLGLIKSKILIGHKGLGNWGLFANATGDTLYNKTDTVNSTLTLTTRPDSSRLWGVNLSNIMDLTSTQTASSKTFTSPQLNNPIFNTTSVVGQYWIANNTSGGGTWGTAASGITGVGTFSSASIFNGGTVSGINLILGVADTNNVGMLSITSQAIKGPKNFISALTASNTVTLTGLTAGAKTDSAITKDAAGNLHFKAAFFLDTTGVQPGYVPGWDATSRTFKTQVNGTGSPNSSVGSGFRLAIAGTNNIKSVSVGLGIIVDSVTSNQVNFSLDTSYAVTKASTQNITGSKNFSGNIKIITNYAAPTTSTKLLTVDSLSGDVRRVGYQSIDTSGIVDGAFVKWNNTAKTFVVTSSFGVGTVTIFTAGDIAGFATQSVATATSTPALTYTLVNSSPHKFWGNFTGSTTTASYGSPLLASADFANQGTTVGLLHGNAAGNPSWGPVSLITDVTGLLQQAQFPALSGDISNTSGSLVTSIGAAKVTNTMLFGGIDLTTKVINILSGSNGGDGINNGSNTETRGGNVIFSGANNVTFVSTAATNITLPTSGTLLNTTGSGASLSGIPLSIIGTANEVISSASTGAITLSLPQPIGTGNSPIFSGATFNGGVKIADGTQGANLFLKSDALGNASWSTPPSGANVFNGWQSISSGTSGTMSNNNTVFAATVQIATYALATVSSPVDGQTFDIYCSSLTGHGVTSFTITTTAFGGIIMPGLSSGSSSTTAVALILGDHYHGQYLATQQVWLINKN